MIAFYFCPYSWFCFSSGKEKVKLRKNTLPFAPLSSGFLQLLDSMGEDQYCFNEWTGKESC
jgi:hypothetical protein